MTILHPAGPIQYYRRTSDYFTPCRPHTVLQESQWLFYTLQAPYSITGEPVTILHPAGPIQYYRRASDYFTPCRPHTVLQESQWLFYTLQAPYSITGEPVTILHPAGPTQYYRRASDYFTLYCTGHTEYYSRASIKQRKGQSLIDGVVSCRHWDKMTAPVVNKRRKIKYRYYAHFISY